MNRTNVLFPLSTLGALLAPAATAQVSFTIDSHGPTIGAPDGYTGTPITEGDILTPATAPPFGPNAPALAAPPPPGIMISGGVGPPMGLGLPGHPACVGHAPATPCPTEIDAMSYGVDHWLPPMPTPPGTFWWSVDEYATGTPVPAPPNVFTEGMFGPQFEAAADTFTELGIPLPGPLFPFAIPPANVAAIDGNGLPNTAGVAYPGLGLLEPIFPFPPPNTGDNVDGIDIGGPVPVAPFPVYYSLDWGLADPLTGFPGSGTGPFHGFSGADVVVTPGPFAGALPFAPAALLGLDAAGFDTDDLDALILWENGSGVFEPSLVPYDWFTMPALHDQLLFSVRRGSAVIGMPDSIFGLPISEGDILTTPLPIALGGVSMFPGIFIAAENLGLGTLRSGTVGHSGFDDDLDALDAIGAPLFDCDMNGVEDAADIALGTHTDANMNGIPDICEGGGFFSSCFCATGAPCGNTDAGAGCVNSTGVGGLLVATGSPSVGADDLVLTASQLPPGESAILFMGPATVFPVVLADGLRCVGGPFCRFPVMTSSAAGVIVNGPGLVALSGTFPPPCVPITAFSTWTFQEWYRDPTGSPCGSTSNVTNAVTVVFVP